MEGYDVGCGAGGGQDSANVLEKSGVIILTSSSIKNEKRDSKFSFVFSKLKCLFQISGVLSDFRPYELHIMGDWYITIVGDILNITS